MFKCCKFEEYLEYDINAKCLSCKVQILAYKFITFKLDVTKTGNGEWGMGNGEWGMGNGEWGMGNGEWGMGNGKLKMGNGKWEIENGKLIFFYINFFIMWNKFF